MNANRTTSLNNKKQAMTLLALSFALFSGNVAVAQGLEAGPMGTLSPSTIIGNDADTMLPPEVVPLDPSVAQRMQQVQAAARAAGAANQNPNPSIPGIVNPMEDKLAGMQSAKDARKAVLESLMGNGQVAPQHAQLMNQAIGAAPMSGPTAGGALIGTMQAPMGTPGVQQVGQSAWMQPGQTNGAIPSHTQSQTLTGGVKNQPVRHDTKRGGLTHAVSGISALGGAMFLGGAAGYPSSPLGLGIFGLGATGFGTRNGFRL
jgi:hypothetical protein